MNILAKSIKLNLIIQAALKSFLIFLKISSLILLQKILPPTCLPALLLKQTASAPLASHPKRW